MLYVRSPSGTLFHLFFFQFHPFSIKFLHCCREVGKCKRENIKKTWGYVQLRCSWVHSVFPLVPVTVPWLTLTFLSSTTYSPRMSRVSDSNKSQFTSVMGYVPVCKAESYTVHASKWLWVISTSVSSDYNMEWLPPHSLHGAPSPSTCTIICNTCSHTPISEKSLFLLFWDNPSIGAIPPQCSSAYLLAFHELAPLFIFSIISPLEKMSFKVSIIFLSPQGTLLNPLPPLLFVNIKLLEIASFTCLPLAV